MVSKTGRKKAGSKSHRKRHHKGGSKTKLRHLLKSYKKKMY